MADFEKNHPGIAAQELWKLFLRKVEEQNLGPEFTSAVEKVCAIGLDLSKYIVRFFPTFTLHDETHSANVCRWMWVLLGKEGRKMLTAHEAALLLMAACCHDVGMSVSPDQEERMRRRDYPGWDEYFRENLADDADYWRTGEISDRMLRNFVRMHHHERVGENLRESDWPHALVMEELDRDVLLKLCRSHGTELTDGELSCREELYDLRMCAVLLRLADLLDFDAGRTPEVLFRQMGLEQPKDAERWRSAQEHYKNRAGKFREHFVNGRIPYVAVYDNPGVEQDIRKYLDWVDQELTKSRNCLSQSASHWKNLDLPYKVDEKVKRNGYDAGKFCMTMDQDRVLDLLTGENLYSDAGVFVRELLQNSIDAVLMRAKQDPAFSLEDGLIQIDTWMDEEANTWFRIRDNGTGMNKHIIQNHFLKVGNSYYTSEEFKYANRHAPKGSYTAISRFGIGILSCFMGDKEHTRLKVSTKRFGEGPKNGIRLDVTGLHGYYFLCNEKDHPENEPWFPKMPSQDGNDQGYRTEPGTTICVNTNLLQMGELRSFREILDKYVQFPEVRVEYQGLGGDHVYPTQQELMEAVYALNPDGVVKEYVHEIPDAEFEKLKEAFPYHIWEKKLTVSLWYEPLNWLSDSQKLMGVRVRSEIGKSQVRVRDGVEANLKQRLAEKKMMLSVEDISTSGVRIHGRLQTIDGYPMRFDSTEFRNMEYGVHLSLALRRNDFFLSMPEQRVWEQLRGALQNAGAERAISVYNGVLACGENVVGTDCCVRILRDDFSPQVNMSRNQITGLPLEAVCCYAMGGLSGLVLDGSWMLATKRELWAILDCHPNWMECLVKEEKKKIRYTDDSRIFLWMAHWKRMGKVIYDDGMLRTEIGEPMNEGAAEFPAGMFVWSEKPELRFPCGLGHGVYNCAHPFSQWLIKNQASLAEYAPKLYNTMIRTMVLKRDLLEVMITLNKILDKLKTYQGNPFRVPADMVLTIDDFA